MAIPKIGTNYEKLAIWLGWDAPYIDEYTSGNEYEFTKGQEWDFDYLEEALEEHKEAAVARLKENHFANKFGSKLVEHVVELGRKKVRLLELNP